MLLHSAAIPTCIGAPPSHAGVLQVASELLRLLFNFPHWQPELLRLYTSAPTPHASHCASGLGLGVGLLGSLGLNEVRRKALIPYTRVVKQLPPTRSRAKSCAISRLTCGQCCLYTGTNLTHQQGTRQQSACVGLTYVPFMVTGIGVSTYKYEAQKSTCTLRIPNTREVSVLRSRAPLAGFRLRPHGARILVCTICTV